MIHRAYLGMRGRRQYWQGDCGHAVTQPRYRRCANCRRATARYRTANGYEYVPGGGNKLLAHRVLAEQALGRPLRPHEVVHHINCDSRDNRPENLLICTQGFHRYLHEQMARAWARLVLPPAPEPQLRLFTGRYHSRVRNAGT